MNRRSDDDEEFEEDENEEYNHDNPYIPDSNLEKNEKFKKFTEIASKKGDLKQVSNNHYDMAYEMNESVSVEEHSTHKIDSEGLGIHHEHNLDKLNYDEEEEEEDEPADQSKQNNLNYLKLSFF
jgi:hypothetical protein